MICIYNWDIDDRLSLCPFDWAALNTYSGCKESHSLDNLCRNLLVTACLVTKVN